MPIIGEKCSHIGQRRIMFGIRQSGIAIPDKNDVVIHLHRVTRRGFTATVGQRTGNDQCIDFALIQNGVKLARPGNQPAAAFY